MKYHKSPEFQWIINTMVAQIRLQNQEDYFLVDHWNLLFECAIQMYTDKKNKLDKSNPQAVSAYLVPIWNLLPINPQHNNHDQQSATLQAAHPETSGLAQ
jgi:hypothetical protein